MTYRELVEVARARGLSAEVAAWPAERILSAMGWPGFGREFAADVLDVVVRKGCSVAAGIDAVRYAFAEGVAW